MQEKLGGFEPSRLPEVDGRSVAMCLPGVGRGPPWGRQTASGWTATPVWGQLVGEGGALAQPAALWALARQGPVPSGPGGAGGGHLQTEVRLGPGRGNGGWAGGWERPESGWAGRVHVCTCAYVPGPWRGGGGGGEGDVVVGGGLMSQRDCPARPWTGGLIRTIRPHVGSRLCR